MKLGLVGYGKMGSEIFSLFFDSLKDAQFVIISRHDNEKNCEGVEKLLAKQLKRKRLTQEAYEAKCSSFRFTDDYNELCGCDAVIECVSEDMALKKELFAKIAGIVSPETLLLTNTSSLDISEVFSDIPEAARCLGMHFFYPVKLSGFVELNYLPENTLEVLDRAESLITAAGKRALRFAGDYHIYLNQILAMCISHSIYVSESTGVSAEQFDAAVKEIFPYAGPFSILDTVGPGLMAKNPEGFRIPRNAALLRYGNEILNTWIAEGCPVESGGFLDYVKEKQKPADNSDTSGFKDGILATVLNAAVFAAKESGCDKGALLDAIGDVLGLADTLPAYYHAMGYERITAVLERFKSDTGYETYEAAAKADYEEIYI